MVNHVLLIHNLPSLVFSKKEFNELKKCDEIEGYLLLVETIKKHQNYPIKNKQKRSYSEIYNLIKTKEEYLKNKYKVKELYIYGSYSKGTNKEDSDIDLLVKIAQDVIYDELQRLVEQLKQYLSEELKTIVDIHQMCEYVSDDLIKSTKKIRRII